MPMKFPFTARIKQLWWRGREGKCLLRSISKAKRLQRNGNDAGMRSVLTAADFAVEAIQRNELSFAKHWQDLLKFQLATFDLRGAEKTVRRAKAPVMNEVMEIVTRTAAWEALWTPPALRCERDGSRHPAKMGF